LGMSDQQYWNNAWRRRASRRSMLRATGVAGLGLAGAALIGCGDDDDDPTPTGTAPPAGNSTPAGGGGATATAPTPPTSGQPTQGGHLTLVMPSLPQENFNTVTNTTEGNYGSTHHVYDSLLSPRVGLSREDSLRAA